MRTSQVNASRLRTFFEMIGCAAQFVPKIPELLRRNRGNEEALFSALSKRYMRRCAVVFFFCHHRLASSSCCGDDSELFLEHSLVRRAKKKKKKKKKKKN